MKLNQLTAQRSTGTRLGGAQSGTGRSGGGRSRGGGRCCSGGRRRSREDQADAAVVDAEADESLLKQIHFVGTLEIGLEGRNVEAIQAAAGWK